MYDWYVFVIVIVKGEFKISEICEGIKSKR